MGKRKPSFRMADAEAQLPVVTKHNRRKDNREYHVLDLSPGQYRSVRLTVPMAVDCLANLDAIQEFVKIFSHEVQSNDADVSDVFHKH